MVSKSTIRNSTRLYRGLQTIFLSLSTDTGIQPPRTYVRK